jgi:hypothetical protein
MEMGPGKNLEPVASKPGSFAFAPSREADACEDQADHQDSNRRAPLGILVPVSGWKLPRTCVGLTGFEPATT